MRPERMASAPRLAPILLPISDQPAPRVDSVKRREDRIQTHCDERDEDEQDGDDSPMKMTDHDSPSHAAKRQTTCDSHVWREENQIRRAKVCRCGGTWESARAG